MRRQVTISGDDPDMHDRFKLAAAGVSLVAIYPTMKRWTYWPQALLGMSVLKTRVEHE